jgi:glutamate racemase
MDNRPIGVFDSGVGGLTAVKALRKLLPDEDIIYFGDSGRMPYGGRPLTELLKIAEQDTEFLLEKNVKAILAACGTTDSNAMPHLKETFDIPLFGVVCPAAAAAAAATRSGRIGIISTEATARSDAYGRALREIKPSLCVITKGCPLIAPLAEQGHIGKDDPILNGALKEYLAPVISENVDTLILGCTHYPLVAEVISDVIGRDVIMINSGAESAAALARYLSENGMLCEHSNKKNTVFYTSGDERVFASVAEIFLGENIAGDVHGVVPFAL